MTRFLCWTTWPVRRGGVRAIQWLWERVTIPIGEEHMLRRPLLTVQAQGFQVERAERSKLGIVERLAARKPAQPTSPS
jgi:hypothetical protein